MFTKLTPQRIQHDSGYIVQTGGRYSLQYIDGDLLAEIQVDFATVTGLYPQTMTIKKGEISRAPTDRERETILCGIKLALDYWGMKYEICEGRAP